MSNIYIILILLVLVSSCKNSLKEKNNESELKSKKEIPLKNNDTVFNDTIKNTPDAKPNTLIGDVISIENWEIKDFIVTENYKKSLSVSTMVVSEKEEWKNVKNPIIATFKGSDFGDYFHLIFKDSNGREYDFGFGNNNFGDYTLYDKPNYNDNPKLVGKTFKVYWNWIISTFPCCDGEYEPVEVYLPSITKLELIEKK